MLRIHRAARAASLGFTAIWLLCAATAVHAQQSNLSAATLNRAAQWPTALPGLGEIPILVSGTAQPNGFSGQLPTILRAPNQPPVSVVGFRQSPQRPFTVAVLLPRFSLGTLVPALQRTPLSDLIFDQAVMIFVPPGAGAGATTLPAAVAQRLQKSSVVLKEGVNFLANAAVYGQTASLLTQVGATSLVLPVTGQFDPAVLAAPSPGASQMPPSFLQTLDLTIPLSGLRTNWSPRYLTLSNAVLGLRGEQGGVVASVYADMTVRLSPTQVLSIPATQLSRDTRTGDLVLAGGPIKPPPGVLTLPAEIAALNTLSFTGTSGAAAKSFSLSGDATIRGKPDKYQATLSENPAGHADYTFGVSGNQTLADLLGWSLPGLEEIQVTNISGGHDAAGSYTSGTVQIGGIASSLTVFRPSAGARPIAAITLPTLHLPDLIPQLRGSPLDGMQISKPGFILAPAGQSPGPLTLPGPVATHTGLSSTEIKGGLNLKGQAMPAGELAQLIRSAGMGNLLGAGLPVSGSLDPRMLKGGGIAGDVANAILASIDLNIPLGNIKPDWMAGYLAFNEAKLTVRNVKGSIVAAVAADASIRVGTGQPLLFPDTQLTRDMRSGRLSLSGGPIRPPAGTLTLPAHIASLDALAFAGSIDGATRSFTLTGNGQVENRPESFTITLSGTGQRADYAFSLTGTQSLADLLGWQVPGLEDIRVSNISIGSGNSATGGPSYTGGTIQIGSVAANVFVFKPGVPSTQGGEARSGAETSSPAVAGGLPSLAAITLPSLHLPDYVLQLKGSPLDGVHISNPGFILAPSGLAFSALALPGPVAAHTGTPSTDVKGGMNLKGQAMPAGKIGDLINAAGLGRLMSSGLPLTGSLDPRLLKGGAIAGDIASAIIESIDLSAPLGTLSIPGVPSLLSATNSTLAIKGHTGGVTVSLRAPVSLNAGEHRYAFDSTITVDRKEGATETTIAGDYLATSVKGVDNAIDKAFGIPWLKLEKVALSATIGPKKSIAVSGTTTIGDVRNLTATVFINADGSQLTDFGVSLTGADIALSDIPGFSAIKNVPDIRFRDVLISESEVAGTLRTSNPMFDNLRAVIFRTGKQATLAAMREKFTLEDIIPLPGPAKAIFSGIVFDKGLLIVSESGLQGPVSGLPKAAAAMLTEVYGDPKRILKLGNGFNVAIALDPGAMGKQGLGQLGMKRGNYVLDGAIEGVFGGAPSFALSAAIPPINFPNSLNFLDPPKNLQTSFFTRLAGTDAALGVSVNGDFPMKTRQGSVVFTNALSFEVDTQGGLAIVMTGTSDTPWPNPLGVPGMTLNPGTSLGLKVSATSELDLTFIGKSKIGRKEIDLTGNAGILVAEGLIDKGAFEGKLSELGLEDIVDLAAAASAATGSKPPAANFPVAKLTDIDVAFASPGAVVQGMNLSGGGSRIAGDLWLLLKDKPLGKLLAQVDGNGIILSGSLSDFSIGPVSLKGNSLDARAIVMPPTPPNFKVRGGASLFNKEQNAELELSPTEMELAMDIDLGDLLKFDFRAKADIPLKGMSLSELEKSDMSLKARLRSDIPAWLRGPGRESVNKSFASVREGLKQFTDDLDKAQKAVSSLDEQIEKARAQVGNEKRSADENLADAEKQVNTLHDRIKSLDHEISDAESRIHRHCDYTKRICTWYDIFKKECTAHKSVPDLIADASCASDNIKYGAIKAAKTAARDGVIAAKTTADATLDTLRKGGTIDTVDLDPRVAPLIVSRATAQGVLDAAQAAAQGALKAEGAIQSALDSMARSDAFAMNDSLLQGSMRKAIAGQPVVLDMDFTTLGKPYSIRLAFSITDPALDAEELTTLGLFIASKILEDNYSQDKSMAPVLSLVHAAYAATHKASEAKVEKAMKENGLE